MSSALSLSRLESLRKWPNLASNWHFLSASVLTALNKTPMVPIVYEHALKHTPVADQLAVTQQFREALLKSSVIIGLPRVINGLTALKSVTPEPLRATKLLRDASRTDFRLDGEQLFAQIYTKITNRVQRNLYSAYPDLQWFIQNCEYGPLLAHTSVLNAQQTSLVVIAALVPQNVDPQLKGHLKGALNTGSSVDEVNSVRELAMTVGEWFDHPFPSAVSKLG